MLATIAHRLHSNDFSRFEAQRNTSGCRQYRYRHGKNDDQYGSTDSHDQLSASHYLVDLAGGQVMSSQAS
jgi:hypothetical protein